MSEAGPAEIRRGDVDGVPVFWTEKPPPLRAALMFRVGQTDEDLPWRGLTHLVEHLALAGFAHQTYPYNGFVDNLRTVFFAQGTEDQLTAFLNGVAAALSNPAGDRVEAERRVLTSEEASKPAGSWAQHLGLRYGPNGPGLGDYPQYGLSWLGPDAVRRWSSERFCRENGAVWISGPPPSGLRLELPAGERRSVPRAVPLQFPTPCHVVHNTRGVGIAMVGKRSLALTIGARILGRRAREALRWQQGVAYSPDSNYWPLDSETAHLFFFSDALPEQAETVAAGLLKVLEDLRVQGPTQAELDDDRALLEAARAQPGWDVGRLERAVREHLGLDPPYESEDMLDRHREVTTRQVAADLTTAWESALVLVPSAAARAAAGLATYPGWSSDNVGGRPLRRRLRSPGEAPQGTRMLVSPEGVTAVFPGSKMVTVRFRRLAAVLWWHSGLRVLIGRDGFTLRFRASEWLDADAVLEQIRTSVAPDRFVPMDAPDVDPERERSGCEVCGGHPAVRVRLYEGGWLPRLERRFTGRLCKDCGRGLGRDWTNASLLHSLSVVGLGSALIAGAVDAYALIQLARLQPAQRREGADHWLSKSSIFARAGVWVFVAVSLLAVLIVVAALGSSSS